MTILYEPDQLTASTLVSSLDDTVRTVASLSEVAMSMAADPDEKLVVIGSGAGLDQVLTFSKLVRVERPDVTVLLVRDDLDPLAVADAHDAGVREVIRATDTQALGEACLRVRAGEISPSEAQAVPRPQGRVITVFGAKGGCGKTTIAINLAVVLSANGLRRVCLVDLDLAFGDVAICLKLSPNRTMIDAVAADGTFDGQLGDSRLDALLTPYRPGMDCVLAPVGPGDAEKAPAGLVSALLDALRARYDFIVIDTPSQLSEHVLTAMDASQHLVLLAAPEVPALKNLRLTLDILDLLSLNNDSRAVLLNRCDSQVGLNADDVRAAIKSEIAAQVPSSRDVPVSINRGVPIAQENPEHPVSRAIREFAQRAIVGEDVSHKRRFGRLGSRLSRQTA